MTESEVQSNNNIPKDRNAIEASGGSPASYIDAVISSYDVVSALNNQDCKKYDAVQLFTAKVLIYVGCGHLCQYGHAIVKAISLLALHPNADMSVLGAKQIINGEINTTYARAIKIVFDVNDVPLIERIEKLTESKIFTAMDALYNLASFIRLKFSIGRVINA